MQFAYHMLKYCFLEAPDQDHGFFLAFGPDLTDSSPLIPSLNSTIEPLKYDAFNIDRSSHIANIQCLTLYFWTYLWGNCHFWCFIISLVLKTFLSFSFFLFFNLLCRNPLILNPESYVPQILQVFNKRICTFIWFTALGINMKCLWYDSLSKLQLYTALRF